MRIPSRTLLIAVACCAGLFGVILALAYLSPAARELDAKALHSSLGVHNYASLLLMDRIRQLADPAAVGVQLVCSRRSRCCAGGRGSHSPWSGCSR